MLKRSLAVVLCAGLLAATAPPASASPVIVLTVCFGEATRVWKPNERGVVRGTKGADVIAPGRRARIVKGRGGDDKICATRGPQTVFGGPGHDLISTWRGNDRIHGGPGDDYEDGGPGRDEIDGGYGGSDTLVGGGGADLLVGGHGPGDDDFLFGGRADDRLVGGEGDDLLVGGTGADVLDGGYGSSDTVNFAFEEAAVVVDLVTQGRPLGSGDVLHGIENVRGSVFDDTITGTREDNVLSGDDGNDTISSGTGADIVDGGVGADVLDGGVDIDLLSFLDSPVGVGSDLAAGSSSDGDTLTNFEHVDGSAYDDEIYGDDGRNSLTGSRGVDQLFGRGGDDTLSSGSGDAGEGEDMCFDLEGEIESCELLAPVMPLRRSTIDVPAHGSVLEVSELKTLSGTGGASEVALRRMSRSGCYWWDARHSFMEAWHCNRPIWNETKLQDDGSWSKRIPSPVQLLNPGRYEVWSRIKDGDFTEDHFQAPYNVVQFRLR